MCSQLLHHVFICVVRVQCDGVEARPGSSLSLRSGVTGVVQKPVTSDQHAKAVTVTNHVPQSSSSSTNQNQPPTVPQVAAVKVPTKYPSASASTQRPTSRRFSAGGENGDSIGTGNDCHTDD